MDAFWSDLMSGELYALKAVAIVYLVVVVAFSTYSSLRIRQWPQTTGTLIEEKLHMFGGGGSDRMYAASVAYDYQVGGQTFRGTRLSPLIFHTTAARMVRAYMTGIQRLEGDTVVVFYNPARPQKSYLIVPSMRVIWSVIALGGLCLALLAFAG